MNNYYYCLIIRQLVLLLKHISSINVLIHEDFGRDISIQIKFLVLVPDNWMGVLLHTDLAIGLHMIPTMQFRKY